MSTKIILVIFLLSGCSHFSKRSAGNRQISSESLLEKLELKQEDVQDLSVDDKIATFHDLEQTTVSGAIDDSGQAITGAKKVGVIENQRNVRKYFTEAFRVLGDESGEFIRLNLSGKYKQQIPSSEILNEAGQVYNDDEWIPTNFSLGSMQEYIKFRIKELNKIFKEDVEKKNCSTLKHSYLSSMTQLLRLAPSFDYHALWDIFYSLGDTGPEKSKLIKDQTRLAWQFIDLIALSSFKSLKSCKFKGSSYLIVQEFRLRLGMGFEQEFLHKPLGFAIGMCGRPMNSHYADRFIDNKEREVPSNWDFRSINKIKEYLRKSEDQ